MSHQIIVKDERRTVATQKCTKFLQLPIDALFQQGTDIFWKNSAATAVLVNGDAQTLKWLESALKDSDCITRPDLKLTLLLENA